MSSFVVEDKTINKIVSYLDYHLAHDLSWLKNKYQELGYYPEGFDDVLAVKQLATDLFNMNVIAVDARYGKGEAKEFRNLDFKQEMIYGVPALWVLKSLHCLLYQCSEGNVPETALYKLLEETKNVIADRIVTDLPDYEAAPWG